MAFAFHRRLAIPLWAMALFAVAVTAPPPALLALIAVFGVTVIAFTTPGLVAWLRASSSVVYVLSQGRRRHNGSAAISMAAAACARTLDDGNTKTAHESLDLVRMEEDGGWQMARPPA